MSKYISPILLTTVSMSLLSGCVTQSFENNEPIVKNQANRDEMAATRVSLGLGYLGMGDMSQAKLNLEKAKAFSPNLVQVHTAFAHYYETVGEGDLAVESFEKALTIKDDSADTLNNYGVFLCRQGKILAAEKQFLKAISVPTYLLVSESYENLSSCFLQNDDFEKAEMYLKKAVYHSPNRTTTLLQMVRLQYAMENYKEGKRFLQKFERNTQRFTADSLALAYKLYWKLGQRRTATNYANMLIKMYPQSWEGKQYLLNELEFIEVDNLAKKYQLTQKKKSKTLSPSSNKRVVKLSPNKASNSPYTNSVQTASIPATGAQPSEGMAIVTSAVMPITATPQVATSAGQGILGAGSVLVSATVMGTAATTSVASYPVSNPVSNAASITTSNTAANLVTSSAVPNAAIIVPVVHQSVVEAQTITNSIEPTSTQPIPATRDVPLPEALPIEVEVVTSKAVEEQVVLNEKTAIAAPVTTAAVTEGLASESENIETIVAFHTVAPGENLYNISVKYNVKLNTLRKWNNIPEKNNIQMGDKLYVVDPTTVNNIND